MTDNPDKDCKTLADGSCVAEKCMHTMGGATMTYDPKNPRTFRLFVDDNREPPKGWMCARTVSDTILFLRSFSPIAEISLDHDILFPQHGVDRYSMYSAENYKGVACYIESMPEGLRPRRIRIHSSNAGAARTMAEIMGVPYELAYKPFDAKDYADAAPVQ